jgi:hypothetical protein
LIDEIIIKSEEGGIIVNVVGSLSELVVTQESGKANANNIPLSLTKRLSM